MYQDDARGRGFLSDALSDGWDGRTEQDLWEVISGCYSGEQRSLKC